MKTAECSALRVDAEFKALIPPLAEEEYRQLEENLKQDGCRDPLVAWNDILLDGHNRYEICERHGIGYRVVEIDLPDRDAACDWIDANQLGRRNLTPDQQSLLRGRRYNRAKKKQHDGGKGKTRSGGQLDPHLRTANVLAQQHGVSPATIKRDAKKAEFVEHLEKTKPQKAAAIKEGKKRIVEVKRELKEEAREKRREENRKLIATTPAPADVAPAKYATIVIDPPWDWGDEGDVDQMGRAKPTYGTMGFDQLKALPVGGMADDDCHIYLWITNRSLPKGFALLDAWGFRYVTALTWPKPSFGMGNYFRGQTEHVLFGVKGSQSLKRKDASTLLPAWNRGPGGHSSKPIEFYEFIESCSPGPFLEMFARSSRKNWVAWGAEVK